MTHKENLLTKLEAYAKKTVTEVKAKEIVDYAEQHYDNLKKSGKYDDNTIENNVLLDVSKKYQEIFMKDIIKDIKRNVMN